MRWALVVIFAYVLIVIQTTLFDTRLLAFQILGVWIKPDLLLLMLLFIALRAEAVEVFIAGWALGLAEDLIVSEGPLGIGALMFGTGGYLLTLFRRVLGRERILTQVFLALGLVFAVRLPQQRLLFWFTGSSAGWLDVLEKACGDAVYSAALAPYLLWGLGKTAARGGAEGL